jgi:RNA polymerase sigma-70 factor (ECF subfamily)
METASPLDPRELETGLARRAAAGEEAAFEELVGRYSRPILDYCRRLVGHATAAEDLAQEVFVKFYLALSSFDPSRAVSPFLYRIAHNHCMDWLRKKKVPTVPLVWEDEDGGAREAEAIMRHRQGMTYEEIAEALDTPLGTVKARIHRGREKLQQKLAKYV